MDGYAGLGDGPGAVAVVWPARGVNQEGMTQVDVAGVSRGEGLGRLLVQASVDWARSAGYPRMLLDTLPQMHAAQRLYERFGFADVEAYRSSPIPTRFMGLDLKA